MNGSVFLDTNVLVYLFDRDAPVKQARARAILADEAVPGRAFISTQVLQEFYVSVTRKLAHPLLPEEAEQAVVRLATLPTYQVHSDTVLAAVQVSRRHQVSFWDALIIQAAASSGCDRLLSEDLQHGRQVDSVRIENPFLVS